MAISQPTELRALDRFTAAMQTITAAGGLFLTTPAVSGGTPLDEVSTGDVPHIFTDFVSSEPSEDYGNATHRVLITLVAYVVVKDVRTLLAVVADIRRAVFASENGFVQEFGQPLWPDRVAVRDEMTEAGEYVAAVLAKLTTEFTHAAP